MRSTPLYRDESGPAPDELAYSRERQARVAQWLMAHSRAAAPREDARGAFEPNAGADGAPEAQSEEPAAGARRSAASSAAAPMYANASPGAAWAASAATVAAPAPESPVHAPESSTTRAVPADADGGILPATIVWEGPTVPVDRIASNVRLLTPQVGSVRAALRNGSTIEGRLHAVGTGQVWIDERAGRVALQRDEIVRLEQIASPPPARDDEIRDADAAEPREEATTAAPIAGGTSETATTVLDKIADATQADGRPVPSEPAPPAEPPRVRVRTPGGVFYGQVIARDGTTLTLVTDEGSRIVLESDDVEPAPLGKAVVKRDVAAKQGAAKP